MYHIFILWSTIKFSGCILFYTLYRKSTCPLMRTYTSSLHMYNTLTLPVSWNVCMWCFIRLYFLTFICDFFITCTNTGYLYLKICHQNGTRVMMSFCYNLPSEYNSRHQRDVHGGSHGHLLLPIAHVPVTLSLMTAKETCLSRSHCDWTAQLF